MNVQSLIFQSRLQLFQHVRSDGSQGGIFTAQFRNLILIAYITGRKLIQLLARLCNSRLNIFQILLLIYHAIRCEHQCNILSHRLQAGNHGKGTLYICKRLIVHLLCSF